MTMLRLPCPVESVREVAENTYLLTFLSASLASSVQPGQFVNILIDGGQGPLLRRPFSVYRTEAGRVEIVFNVVGRGTAAMRRKRPGDVLDILGPLGTPFRVRSDDFSTAVLVAGGLGVAPLPITTAALKAAGKDVVTFLGARTATQLVEIHLPNLSVATDDGTRGYRGTVVDLIRSVVPGMNIPRPKIFGCGPTAMLRGVASFARETGIMCEVSLEGAMGCGFGICQGCPVELVGGGKKYALMCKDGPTFDIRSIKL